MHRRTTGSPGSLTFSGVRGKSERAREQRERTALAERIHKLRAAGKKWDGDDGICEAVGIKNAMQGRALLREFGAGESIKPLTGKRAEQQQAAQERRAKELADRKAKREAKATA